MSDHAYEIESQIRKHFPEARPNLEVFSTRLDFKSVEDGQAVFGGRDEELTFSDGTVVESWVSFNEILWDLAGKPNQIYVAFSTDENFLSALIREDPIPIVQEEEDDE